MEIIVIALSGKSGSRNGVASPAIKPELLLIIDSLLLTTSRSEFLEGTLGLAGVDFLKSVLGSLSSMLSIETIDGRLGRMYVIGVATSIGEHAASATSKTSISSSSGASAIEDSMTLEYRSKEKSESFLKDGASTGFGDDAALSVGMPDMITLRAGALNKPSLTSLCFFISETMIGIPLGVVTLISDSVSTEVEALISADELEEEAGRCVYGNSPSILLDVSGRVSASAIDS